MKVKSTQFIALTAALCWIFAQSISLDHQFTSEHLSQTDSHICLSFVNDNDDLLISDANEVELEKPSKVCPPSLASSTNLAESLSFQARAPPFVIS